MINGIKRAGDLKEFCQTIRDDSHWFQNEQLDAQSRLLSVPPKRGARHSEKACKALQPAMYLSNVRLPVLSVLLICFAFLIEACSPSSSNKNAERSAVLLLNEGFETGTLTPWALYGPVQASVVADHPHSGKYVLSQTTGKGSAYQDVTGLTSGITYTVSAWVFAASETSATAQIAVYDPNSGATFSTAIQPKAQWEPIKHTFKLAVPGFARIHLFRNEGTGILYWDDIQVTPAE